MEKYFQLSKIDPFQGIAVGVAAAEEIDRDNEILDYAASKPYFLDWSKTQKADSQGKSFGNIRLQHDDKRPVGRLLDLQFDDAKKQIRVTAKIEETEARNLLATGVLTGFSIGGKYAKRTPMPNGTVRYVAGPIGEISIVDRPCAPSAVFEAVKSDGTTELRKFAKNGDKSMNTCVFDERYAGKLLKMGVDLSTTAMLVKTSPARLQAWLREQMKECGELNLRLWKRDSIEKGQSAARPKRRERPNEKVMGEGQKEMQDRIAEMITAAISNAGTKVATVKTELRKSGYQNFFERNSYLRRI